MDDFFALFNFIGDVIEKELPSRILEISGGGAEYGYMLKACQELFGIPNGSVERLAAPGSPELPHGAYSRVLNGEYLKNPHLLENYDLILLLDMEDIEAEKARELLDVLQRKVKKQVLILTPLASAAGFRKYHPVFFIGLDFSYLLVPGLNKAMQAFSVFPKIEYAGERIDSITEEGSAEKLHIAFALPHISLTGGLKALLQQIRYLRRSGHEVSVYFRSDSAQSAIPVWSDLTVEDYTRQAVIPTTDRYFDHLRDADIVILGLISQGPEFVFSDIPVVVWEQGAEAMFGDFGRALYSFSPERLNLHGLYRLPVHLLGVSDVIMTALKGKYNRDVFVYPNGVDTSFYHPGEKNNDLPVILLTGHPSLAFKGFRFAFDALNQAYTQGLRFKVRWAAQVGVIHGETNFPLEVVVSPPQHELAEMYRSADVFLCASLYESYPLPPLEAMASGTAVVAADCGGIRTYARHGENCILCRQGDLNAVVNALTALISNQPERQRLADAGRETALQNSAERLVGRLERRLLSIVRYERQQKNRP